VYPRQPVGSPWRDEPIGREPLIDRSEDGLVLGYRIDDMGSGDAPATKGDLPRATANDAGSGIRLKRRI
jgi:hypothetical protein